MAGVKRAGMERMRENEVRKKMLSPEKGGGTRERREARVREPRSQEGENGRGWARRAFWKGIKAGGRGGWHHSPVRLKSTFRKLSWKRVPLNLFAGALLAGGVAGKRR